MSVLEARRFSRVMGEMDSVAGQSPEAQKSQNARWEESGDLEFFMVCKKLADEDVE